MVEEWSRSIAASEQLYLTEVAEAKRKLETHKHHLFRIAPSNSLPGAQQATCEARGEWSSPLEPLHSEGHVGNTSSGNDLRSPMVSPHPDEGSFCPAVSSAAIHDQEMDISPHRSSSNDTGMELSIYHDSSYASPLSEPHTHASIPAPTSVHRSLTPRDTSFEHYCRFTLANHTDTATNVHDEYSFEGRPCNNLTQLKNAILEPGSDLLAIQIILRGKSECSNSTTPAKGLSAGDEQLETTVVSIFGLLAQHGENIRALWIEELHAISLSPIAPVHGSSANLQSIVHLRFGADVHTAIPITMFHTLPNLRCFHVDSEIRHFEPATFWQALLYLCIPERAWTKHLFQRLAGLHTLQLIGEELVDTRNRTLSAGRDSTTRVPAVGIRHAGFQQSSFISIERASYPALTTLDLHLGGSQPSHRLDFPALTHLFVTVEKSWLPTDAPIKNTLSQINAKALSHLSLYFDVEPDHRNTFSRTIEACFTDTSNIRGMISVSHLVVESNLDIGPVGCILRAFSPKMRVLSLVIKYGFDKALWNLLGQPPGPHLCPVLESLRVIHGIPHTQHKNRDHIEIRKRMVSNFFNTRKVLKYLEVQLPGELDPLFYSADGIPPEEWL